MSTSEHAEYMPPVAVSDASVRECVMYANLVLRGENSDQIGTPLTVAISTEFDRWLTGHDAEVTAAALASTPSPAQPTEARETYLDRAIRTNTLPPRGVDPFDYPNESAPSPVQGADDRLAQAEAVIAAIEAWRREPFAGNAEGGIRWTALDHIFRDYQQSPQAALNEVRAQARADEIVAIAAHFDSPGIVWHGHGGVTVYDSTEHSDAGMPRPKDISEWLRARAAELRAAPQTGDNHG